MSRVITSLVVGADPVAIGRGICFGILSQDRGVLHAVFCSESTRVRARVVGGIVTPVPNMSFPLPPGRVVRFSEAGQPIGEVKLELENGQLLANATMADDC